MKPCKRGHDTGRYKSGQCIECHKLRKGPNRKPPEERIAPVIRSTRRLAKVITEETKLLREKARTERLALREQNRATAKVLDKAELERMKANDEKRTARGRTMPWIKAPTAPTLTVTQVPTPPKQPRDGDIVTDSTGQKWLYRIRLVDGQQRIERAPIAAKPEEAASTSSYYVEFEIKGRKFRQYDQPYSDTERPGFTYMAWLFRSKGDYSGRRVYIAPPLSAEPEKLWHPGLGRPPTDEEIRARLRTPATRAELANRHEQTEMPANIPAPLGHGAPSPWRRGNGTGEHVTGNGVRVRDTGGMRDAWRFDGGPNWTKLL